MSLRVGVIGAGVMGADHARNLAARVAGARLTAVSDPDRERAAHVASLAGARAIEDAAALIAEPDVDAVLIASPDHTHAGLALACIAAGKPVLCEKPLAPTPEECLRVVAAESELGRRVVQVGFMRRFDPAYLAMKARFAAGDLGKPHFFHCVHRNAAAPPWFESGMLITNSAVHEIDIARWMLEDEFVRAQVFAPPAAAGALRDPQLVALQTRGGVIVDIEVFLNAAYGYDIRGELVCQYGSVALAPPVQVHTRQAGQEAFGFAPDWRPRFAAAYHNQLQSWIDGISAGTLPGASAWDGYAATAVAAACLQALSSGAPAEVRLEERPALYA